ncbi:MAG: MATE family efflux transporter [Cyanobacteria bacterium P01_E01_bin.42]
MGQISDENVIPSFSRLAIANVLSNITIPLTSFSNLAFLGHLNNTNHLTGVTLVLALFDSLFYSCSFLRISTTSLTAQAMDGDRTQNLSVILLRNGAIALIISLIVLSLKIPLEQVCFSFLKTAPEIESIARTYFEIRIWAVPATLLNFVIIGWLLGQGRSDLVLWITAAINSLKIGLDYLLILKFGLASVGAGLAVAIHQYLLLGCALIVVGSILPFKALYLKNTDAFKLGKLHSLLTLNGNIFVRSLVKMIVLLVFTKVGTALGSKVLTENALVFEVILLVLFLLEGLGYAVETLTGFFEGKGRLEEIFPQLRWAFLSSLCAGVGIAAIVWIFPQQVFSLLTNRTELLQDMNQYTPWLAMILGLSSISSIQESYFFGRTAGHVVRNANLSSAFLGFLPLAIAALWLQNNQILWLAIAVSGLVQTVILAIGFRAN